MTICLPIHGRLRVSISHYLMVGVMCTPNSGVKDGKGDEKEGEMDSRREMRKRNGHTCGVGPDCEAFFKFRPLPPQSQQPRSSERRPETPFRRHQAASAACRRFHPKPPLAARQWGAETALQPSPARQMRTYKEKAKGTSTICQMSDKGLPVSYPSTAASRRLAWMGCLRRSSALRFHAGDRAEGALRGLLLRRGRRGRLASQSRPQRGPWQPAGIADRISHIILYR